LLSITYTPVVACGAVPLPNPVNRPIGSKVRDRFAVSASGTILKALQP